LNCLLELLDLQSVLVYLDRAARFGEGCPYLEVMGAATSFCVIGVAYWVQDLTLQQMAEPPATLQFPFFLGLALAGIAALRGGKWILRLLVHAIWVTALALTVVFLVRQSRTSDVVADLVAQGKLDRAAERLESFIAYQPRDAYARLSAGILRLRLGQFNRYQADCQAMLDEFRGTHSAADADKTAKLCLLAPNAVADVAAVLNLAEMAVDEGYQTVYEAWFYLLRGLAEYRAGHAGNAIDWLRKCQLSPHPIRGPTARLIEAMALARLHQSDDAQTAFREATAAFDAYLASVAQRELASNWPDRAIFELLRDEALQTFSATPSEN
jgi:hypothetical protein